MDRERGTAGQAGTVFPVTGELSDAELDELVEQATVDAYDDEEQLTGLYTMLSEHLAVPFKTVVLGVEVTVKKVDLLPGSQIVAVCTRGKHRQAIGVLDLPLPDQAPEGAMGSPLLERSRELGEGSRRTGTGERKRARINDRLVARAGSPDRRARLEPGRTAVPRRTTSTAAAVPARWPACP